ncbi:Dimethylaniline monooxygenase [Colletotrichum higginsianum IMI 349063]|uniref:Dimethylaniline monooxygenase n=2 Tax=Colletotrichum higginsianum TaxID=80884 RepID=A0A1B7Y4X2_COLHI|nr:Dimethylaniline monooxygenase [Colletotrichum higginsianum IMI 349063]OBR07006.1 Dimethylaniline monooxygenase [Colletotrichum higginsianum IMI 349063]TIC92371.1 hypothetical protein CH35J_010023 [Colletotrichum higginsianum]
MPAELRQDHGIINQNITARSDVAEKLQTGIFTLRRSSIASFTNRKLTRQGGHEWKPVEGAEGPVCRLLWDAGPCAVEAFWRGGQAGAG